MSRRVAVLLLAAGAAYRLVLIVLRVPTNDGDESIVGLMATHIAEGRDFPAYFYGQHYMGALEAYLAAPVVGLFGPTVLALRLPMVLAFYVATGWLLYRLTVRLYTPWFATAVTGLYALGSDHIVSMQLRASGGYPEMDLLGVLLVLLAVLLAERPRTLLFGLWGLVAGLVVWDTWLPLPYLAASAALLIAFRGVRWVPVAAAGFVAGAAPMIAHVAAGNDVLGATLHATAAAAAPLGRQLYDAVVVGVPVANGLCPTDGCHPIAGITLTVAYLALLAVAGWLAARALRGEDRVRQAGRLTLVAAAGLAILLYAQSPAGAAHPLGSARYLHMLPLSLPAVLWPLWAAAAGRWRPAAVAVLAAFAVAMAVSTVAHVTRVPAVAAEDRATRELIAALDRRGITRVYADYPICNQLTFRTGERIVCAVVGPDGRPGLDRYPPFRRLVDAAPDAVYVTRVAGEWRLLPRS